jgi:hypothetical protein
MHTVENNTGINERWMEDLICYCFSYTASDIKDDVRRNRKSTIMEKILFEKRAGVADAQK